MSTSVLRRPLRVALVAVVAALCLGATASAASADTLVGEQFVNAEHSEAISWAGDCNPTGPSTFSFWIFGDATGPHPGGFEEYGTVTLASPSGPVTAFESSWTIWEPETSISGTRSFGESVTASCSAPDGGGSHAFDISVKAPYDVLDPFAESGPSLVELAAGTMQTGFTATFGEQTTPPPSETPARKDDCRRGGWRDYGFKNQGACIKFVVKALER